jgi:hypothetical protein
VVLINHWLIKVKYTLHDAPFIGKGRWTWPLYLLENDHLMDKVSQRGLKLSADISRLQTEQTDR